MSDRSSARDIMLDLMLDQGVRVRALLAAIEHAETAASHGDPSWSQELHAVHRRLAEILDDSRRSLALRRLAVMEAP